MNRETKQTIQMIIAYVGIFGGWAFLIWMFIIYIKAL